MIARGTFREDLYYRLNGITFELPSLAQRKDKERLIRDSLQPRRATVVRRPSRWMPFSAF
jgi:Transcriptional regulator containing PAS, AAA-type ATPase, and DNA-binding domains